MPGPLKSARGISDDSDDPSGEGEDGQRCRERTSNGVWRHSIRTFHSSNLQAAQALPLRDGTARLRKICTFQLLVLVVCRNLWCWWPWRERVFYRRTNAQPQDRSFAEMKKSCSRQGSNQGSMRARARAAGVVASVHQSNRSAYAADALPRFVEFLDPSMRPLPASNGVREIARFRRMCGVGDPKDPRNMLSQCKRRTLRRFNAQQTFLSCENRTTRRKLF